MLCLIRFGILLVIPALFSSASFSQEEYSTDQGSARTIDLSGEWSVELGQSAVHSSQRLKVKLPGSIGQSGIGDVVGSKTKWIGEQRPQLLMRKEFAEFQVEGNYRNPFWLQPDRHYVGKVTFYRTVTVPESWVGRPIVLVLERPHWHTRILVDGKEIGIGNSMSVPHRFDLTNALSAGSHELAIEVDNSLDQLDVGHNSHSVSDHTQGAWNGIIGELKLHNYDEVIIDQVWLEPAPDAKSVRVSFRLGYSDPTAKISLVEGIVSQGSTVIGKSTLVVAKDQVEAVQVFTIDLESPAKTWDEFNPNMCQLVLSVHGNENSIQHNRQVSFAFRNLGTKGTRFVLNDRLIQFRGALDCCVFPKTGYPPTDIESWRRIVRICKDYGLNHLRFHSWCPPKAAFDAADEIGFYYQIECSSWPNQSTSIGDGKQVDSWLYHEAERILDEYGNHPSFMLFAMGNEPTGPENGAKYLRPWLNQIKEKATNQLVTGGSGWPSIDENEYHVTPLPRIQQWGEQLNSRINGRPPETSADYSKFVESHSIPVISHEIGQWCVFPNFKEVEKYTGLLKPKNFEIFAELLRRKNLLDHADQFHQASGKLQALVYKEEIESALRTPGFGGFQLLGLQDFPGQGTALVGVVDPFWDPKSYISSHEYRRFCSPTVPLAKMTKRIWKSNEQFCAEVELSHFGNTPLKLAAPRWHIIDEVEREVASGTFPTSDVRVGEISRVGTIEADLGVVREAAKLELVVELQEELMSNSWAFWVYPDTETIQLNESIHITNSLDEKSSTALMNGGKVLLFIPPSQVNSTIQTGFSPIFWSGAWTGGQAPQTLGILCDPKHSVFRDFPTDFHSDWQWWDLVSKSRPMVLDNIDLPPASLIQVIPDWFDPHRLALMFEAKVGNGRILVCSIDLQNQMAERPVARQLHNSVLQYMESSDFNPKVETSVEIVKGLFVKPQ